MIEQTFDDWLKENWDGDNIFPPGMSSDLAIDFLWKYFIDEFGPIMYSASPKQANTELVAGILQRYSKVYKKEIKKKKKLK